MQQNPLTFFVVYRKIVLKSKRDIQMKKLLNVRPITFVAVSIVLGILSAYFLFTQKMLIMGITILIFVMILTLTFIFVKTKLKIKIIFLLILVTFFSVGAGLFSINYISYENADINNQYLTVKGVISEVGETESGNRYILRNVSFSGLVNKNSKYKIVIYLSEKASFDIGDEIIFTNTVGDNSLLYDDIINMEYLSQGIKYTSFVNANQIQVLGNNKTIFESVNVSIRETLKSGLDEDGFSVAYALLCGNSEFMGKELLNDYRSSGIAHIFAVSGLHIGFLASALAFFLKKIGCNRYLKTFIIISVLIFYSGICGFSASSIRATIMCSVLLFASITGRKYDPLSSVSLALIIILLIFPVQLFCVGFQLSFSVVLGILLLSKRVSLIFKFLPKRLADSLGVVISAQLAGIPICLSAFGYFSAISIITNLLMIPLVSVLYTAIFILTFLAICFGQSAVFLFLPKYALFAINKVISLINYKIFLIGGFTFGVFIICYYLIILFISDKINVGFMAKVIIVSILAVILVTGTTLKTVSNKNNQSVYVIGSQTLDVTLVSSPVCKSLIVSQVEFGFSTNRLSKLIGDLQITKIDKLIFAKQTESFDYQYFISRLLPLVAIDDVYFCKEYVESESIVFNKLFPKMQFTYCTNSFLLQTPNCNFKYALEGYAIDVIFDAQHLTIISNIGNKDINYLCDELKGCSVIIADDKLEQLNAFYSPKKLIGYSNNYLFCNAESKGRVEYNIK